MPNYRHIYRCRCGDWDKNRVEVYTASDQAPFTRLQHFQLRESKVILAIGGKNETCQNYLTWLEVKPHASGVPDSSNMAPKSARRITPSSAISNVVLGPKVVEHVFQAERNGSSATGYHSKDYTTFTGTAPYTIKNATHKLGGFTKLSRPDEYGVYWAAFWLQYTASNQTQQTSWKISVMFPDRLGAAAILTQIKVASVNPRTGGSNSVDWAGECDNGMRIGGHTGEGGLIKSAFPAYKGSFAIPDDVSEKFRNL